MDRPDITTLGALKASGYQPTSIRDEIRTNLMRKLKAGERIFEGIIGYDDTVIPQFINALLSRHNILLLGLRGQAKTRLLRQLVTLLDPWAPAIAGSDVNDDPIQPTSPYGLQMIAEHGDDMPIVWLSAEDRYREKLATPDVSMADLIGDLDPVKAAVEKRSLSDEAVINYGIIPRTNRGIFAINELPDLQPRIQVGLFNILEEKDVQIRGFPVRLPLDLLLVFTANPEDYTNRGSIITPLKDRIESQILTHYPATIADAMRITSQEAWIEREREGQIFVADQLRAAVDRISFAARDSEFVDQASGVSARLPIAALENIVSNIERRALINNESTDCLRVLDIYSALPAITGKVELVYEGEQEGAQRVATALIGKALREAFEESFPSAYQPREDSRRASDSGRMQPSVSGEQSGVYQKIISHFATNERLELSDSMPFEEYRKALQSVAGLEELAAQHCESDDEMAQTVAMELILEGLHQSSLLAKEDMDRGVLYCDMLGSMMDF